MNKKNCRKKDLKIEIHVDLNDGNNILAFKILTII